MKLVTNLAAYLLGIIYFVFGLNFFLHFIPMPPMEGPAGDYIGILAKSGLMYVVKVIEVVGGILLLINRKRLLAYLILLPVSVNIFLFDILIQGIPSLGILLVLLNVFGLITYREKLKVLAA